MNTAIKAETLRFLSALKKNNNSEWFDRNKPTYLQAKANMEAVIGDFIHGISQFDKSFKGLEGKDCLFRIYTSF